MMPLNAKYFEIYTLNSYHTVVHRVTGQGPRDVPEGNASTGYVQTLELRKLKLSFRS